MRNEKYRKSLPMTINIYTFTYLFLCKRFMLFENIIRKSLSLRYYICVTAFFTLQGIWNAIMKHKHPFKFALVLQKLCLDTKKYKIDYFIRI